MAYVTIKPSSNGNAPYARLYVTQGSQSITNNSTVLNWELKIYRPYSVSSSSAKDYYVKMAGEIIHSGTYSISGSGTRTIAKGSHTIKHNSDGTKRVGIGASVEFGITFHGESLGTKYDSGYMTLTTIPRTSSLSVSPTDIYADGVDTVTAKATSKSSSFKDTIAVSLDSYSKTITSGTPFTIPLDWNNVISGTSKTATVKLTTRTSGGDYVGSTSKTLKVMVPENIVPTMEPISVTEANEAIPFEGIFVKGLSKLKVDITANGVYGSKIDSYSTTIDGIVKTGPSIVSNPLTKAGMLHISTSIKDSRGRSVTDAIDVNVVDYFPPNISKFLVNRCDSSGTDDPMGDCVKVTMSGEIASVEGQNVGSILIKYRAIGQPDYIQIPVTMTGTSFIDKIVIIPDIPSSESVEFRIDLSDKATSSYSVMSLGIPTISLLRGGKGVCFFKEAENEGVWIKDIDYTLSETEYQELMTLLGD